MEVDIDNSKFKNNGNNNVYPFISGKVPKYRFDDPEAMSYIKKDMPVILTDSNLVESAKKWDLEYLCQHIGESPLSVFVNKNSENSEKSGQNHRKSHNIFMYYDDKKLTEYKEEFNPDISREELTFQKFLERFRGDRTKERVYLQQPLNNTVGKQIAMDFVKFNWAWTIEKQKDFNWGPLTSNLLIVGQESNITSCHYDEQQNLFCQLKGKKKFLLFPPDSFPCLYPYPVHHPHDRQSQVDFDHPDIKKYPKFRELEGVEAILEDGEILFIPMYWWHHVINLNDTIAINFWHKGGANSPIEYPLKAKQKVAMIRNMEKMLLEALQDQNELGNILHWLVDGRFES